MHENYHQNLGHFLSSLGQAEQQSDLKFENLNFRVGRIIVKFGENSNGICETDMNAGLKAGREPLAHFPGSQLLATFVYFKRCINYEQTASICGYAKGGLRPPAFSPKARFARQRLQIFGVATKLRHEGILVFARECRSVRIIVF